MLVQKSKAPDFSPLPSYDSTLMTPDFLFSNSVSVDKFLSDAETLFEETRKVAEADEEK